MRSLRRVLLASLALFLIAPIPETMAEEVWVAVGYGGRRMISTDGKNWQITEEWAENGKDDSNNLMGLVYGDGRFVAVGGGGWSRKSQQGHILTSEDGRQWKEVKTLANRVNPIAFGDGKFVTMGPPGKSIYTSTNGETWEVTGKIPYDGWALWGRHAAFGNGTFLMMGECEPKKTAYWVAATDDGKQVDFRNDLPRLNDLAFGNGIFLGVGGNGTLATSANGRDWTVGQFDSNAKRSWVVFDGDRFLVGGGKEVLATVDGKDFVSTDLKMRGKLLWTDGDRYISTSWPGKMYFSDDGKIWSGGNKLTPNGINQVVHAELD